MGTAELRYRRKRTLFPKGLDGGSNAAVAEDVVACNKDIRTGPDTLSCRRVIDAAVHFQVATRFDLVEHPPHKLVRRGEAMVRTITGCDAVTAAGIALPTSGLRGTAAIIEAGLREAAPAELNALQWHTVKAGESLTEQEEDQLAQRLNQPA